MPFIVPLLSWRNEMPLSELLCLEHQQALWCMLGACMGAALRLLAGQMAFMHCSPARNEVDQMLSSQSNFFISKVLAASGTSVSLEIAENACESSR